MLDKLNLIQITNIIVSLGVIVSIIFSIYTLSVSREERQYSAFIKTLSYYDTLVEKRHATWKKIKDSVKKNPKTAKEVHDKQNSIGYLQIRARQKEAMFAIEHQLLKQELESLNFINHFCSFKNDDGRIAALIKLRILTEITYYQANLKTIISIYNKERRILVLPKPEFKHLMKYVIPSVTNK